LAVIVVNLFCSAAAPKPLIGFSENNVISGN
jgi:hypothetical protein